MKLWELHSHCREEPDLLRRVAERPEWAQFAEWFDHADALIAGQRRDVLDLELPDDLCRHVLSHSKITYKVSHDGWMRHGGSQLRGERLTALEAFDRYGGWLLEEVNEFGSCQISNRR